MLKEPNGFHYCFSEMERTEDLRHELRTKAVSLVLWMLSHFHAHHNSYKHLNHFRQETNFLMPELANCDTEHIVKKNTW